MEVKNCGPSPSYRVVNDSKGLTSQYKHHGTNWRKGMKKCPHCNLDIDSPAVAQIIAFLERDQRRDIYEIGDVLGNGSGKFTISYGGPEGRMPIFSRSIAEAIEKTGLIKEHECSGWFRRVSA